MTIAEKILRENVPQITFDKIIGAHISDVIKAMEEYRKQGRFYTPAEIRKIEAQAYDAGLAAASMETGA